MKKRIKKRDKRVKRAEERKRQLRLRFEEYYGKEEALSFFQTLFEKRKKIILKRL